ncbi:unnamed protein product [Peniophora sp. CBMAI 1063]|nr:unnamed protein product [Peniophora sp. CBMAI 1063]
MPSKPNNPPGYASGIDIPGLCGFQSLARLIYHDDGEKLVKPEYKVTEQSEYMLKVLVSMAQHFTGKTTEELETAATERHDAVSMNFLAARLYTASRAKQDRDRAIALWTRVSRIELPNGGTITSSSEMTRKYARVKADAYAYLCCHHYRQYERNKALSDLAQAFLCGEGAAKLGLFVACTYYTALAFYKLQEGKARRNEDDERVETESLFLCTMDDAPAMAAIDWKRHKPHCRRPTEEDRALQFNRLATNEKVDVDTSGFNSVEMARAREVAKGSMYKYLGCDNPSPTQKAFGDFLREIEESACGGPRTEEQFVELIKNMPKVMAKSDIDMVFKPKGKGSGTVRVSSGMLSGV